MRKKRSKNAGGIRKILQGTGCDFKKVDTGYKTVNFIPAGSKQNAYIDIIETIFNIFKEIKKLYGFEKRKLTRKNGKCQIRNRFHNPAGWRRQNPVFGQENNTKMRFSLKAVSYLKENAQRSGGRSRQRRIFFAETCIEIGRMSQVITLVHKRAFSCQKYAKKSFGEIFVVDIHK
ncbi:MAG: hypothetical protein ACI4GO_05010 [Hominenteromicrobium sp.]